MLVTAQNPPASGVRWVGRLNIMWTYLFQLILYDLFYGHVYGLLDATIRGQCGLPRTIRNHGKALDSA